MKNLLYLFKKATWQRFYTFIRLSLLTRIISFFSCLALIIWLVTGIFTWYSGKEYIDTFFDTQQILFAKNFAVMNFEPTVNALPKTKQLLAGLKIGGEEDDDALSFAIFSKEGNLLFTDGEDGEDFYFIPNTLGFKNVEIDDEIWRMFWIESLDKERIIVVAQELDYREDMILEILVGQLIPWILSLPLLLAWLTWLLYKEIIPLRRITKHLNTRKSDDISPLDAKNLATEISPLVKALNALFIRTGELLENQRNFVANAAHELRTPLAGLAIQAEVIALYEDDKEAREHALQKLLAGIQRSTRLIDQLLLLSSLENTKEVDKEEQALLQDILKACIHEASDTAAEKDIKLNYGFIKKEIKINHPELWAIAIRNLLDNALRYSKIEDNAEIKISLTNKALIIENTAKHIPNDMLEKLGQRFYRPAGQDTRGTGLGLAIVGHICKLNLCLFKIDNAHKNEKKEYLGKDFTCCVDGILSAILLD